MNENIETLLTQIKDLEKQLAREVQRKEVEFFYEVRQKKIQFTEEAKARNKLLSKRIHRSVLDSTFLVMSTGPILWLFLLPLIAIDLTAVVYQAICFPIYGIAKVRRADYILMDRHRLGYLNPIEKINCVYCSYANGLLGYMVEVAARTEQYWCPIKHALRMKSVHGRYCKFIDYGDAEGYRKQVEEIRRSFEDIEDIEDVEDVELPEDQAGNE